MIPLYYNKLKSNLDLVLIKNNHKLSFNCFKKLQFSMLFRSFLKKLFLIKVNISYLKLNWPLKKIISKHKTLNFSGNTSTTKAGTWLTSISESEILKKISSSGIGSRKLSKTKFPTTKTVDKLVDTI